MTAPNPEIGHCPRCNLTRPLFAPDPSWNWSGGSLCIADWQAVAEARANGGHVDFEDAFDNASDEVLAAWLNPALRRTTPIPEKS